MREDGKELVLAAGEKQPGFNTLLCLFRAFTLLREEEKELVLEAGDSRLALTLSSTCSGLSLY